jgi:hypothetical protein
MSEERVSYIATNLLQSRDNGCTIEQGQTSAPVDWLHLERMLLPLLNTARKAQGKRPVIVPKG